jgi:hypothetical protein
MPVSVSARIASRAAPVTTDLAGSAYDSGRTVYGSARPLSAEGQPLDLVRTGASRAAMRFIATGRDIRTALLPRYTRYLIGRYDVLPNGVLPATWSGALTTIAREEIEAQLRGEP